MRARDDRLGWFRVECDLPRHPKIHAIAEARGLTPEHVVGCLITFWAWVAEFRIDGSVTEADLSAMRRQGVDVDLITASAFLQRSNGKGWVARNWLDFNGYAMREAIRKRALMARGPRAGGAPTVRYGTETVTDTNTETDSKSPPGATHPAPKGGALARPTLEEVTAYCRERAAAGHRPVDPQQWFDHYASNGWRVGPNPMRDWKAAVRTWERSTHGATKAASSGKMDARMIMEFARRQEEIET